MDLAGREIEEAFHACRDNRVDDVGRALDVHAQRRLGLVVIARHTGDGREVHHRVSSMNDLEHRLAITDVALHELDRGKLGNLTQGERVSSQVVEQHQVCAAGETLGNV